MNMGTHSHAQAFANHGWNVSLCVSDGLTPASDIFTCVKYINSYHRLTDEHLQLIWVILNTSSESSSVKCYHLLREFHCFFMQTGSFTLSKNLIEQAVHGGTYLHPSSWKVTAGGSDVQGKALAAISKRNFVECQHHIASLILICNPEKQQQNTYCQLFYSAGKKKTCLFHFK